LASLVAKEFTDNALDAADAAGRPGAVEVSVRDGNLIVADKGTGIRDATPEKIARTFSVARPMLSSKLFRRAQRGAVGNGLRACTGYTAATRGRLVVETGKLRVELQPEPDGTSRVVRSEAIAPVEGLTLTAIAGDAPFTEKDLGWAQDAIELAQQSGNPSFTGRPSPHTFDLDHFRGLLGSVVGNPSVRQFLDQFDGCSGSRVRSRIAAKLQRRSVTSLDAGEQAELLAAMRGATKPPKHEALRPLGRDAVVAAGCAKANASFTEGEHEPRAEIRYCVEAWADGFDPGEQEASLVASIFMNRTRALVSASGSVVARAARP
jgi:DNA topoisomerase VI subunit B